MAEWYEVAFGTAEFAVLNAEFMQPSVIAQPDTIYRAPTQLAPYYPLLAYHWGKAGVTAKAIDYLENAELFVLSVQTPRSKAKRNDKAEESRPHPDGLTQPFHERNSGITGPLFASVQASAPTSQSHAASCQRGPGADGSNVGTLPPKVKGTSAADFCSILRHLPVPEVGLRRARQT